MSPGLDTIIMLGHQVEIAEQLQEAQKNLEKAKGEVTSRKNNNRE